MLFLAGPVTFLGFLSLLPYFIIESTAQDKKWRVRRLLVRVKVRRVLMVGKAHRRVYMMGKAREVPNLAG